ncbi:MAG: S-layer homology domain-containing protein, partial [Oscillospiraceae bacterium]
DTKNKTVSVKRTVNVAAGFKEDGDSAFGKTTTSSVGKNVSNIVDGNKYTGWTASENAGFATIDLGSAQYLSNFVVEAGNDNIKKFSVQLSKDNKTWVDACNGTTVTTKQTINFLPIEARYIKLNILEATGGFDVRTVEVKFDDKGKVALATESLKISADLNNIKADIGLPIKGLYDSTITWVSSSPNVISNTGNVNRPGSGQSNAKLNLTATVKLGTETKNKDFSATVIAKPPTGGGGTGGGGTGGGSHGGGTGGGGSIIVDSDLMPKPTSIPKPSATVAPTPTPGVNNSGFDDVSADYWANEYITKLRDKKIISGKEDKIFDPEGNITREEYVTIMLNIFGLSKDGAVANFEDVDENAWYYKAVATGVSLGIINGVAPNMFGSGEPITREDMAVIALRTSDVAKNKLSTDKEIKISDLDTISTYARTAVETLIKAGVLNGDEAGNFNPKNDATRAEAAKIGYVLDSTKNSSGGSTTGDPVKPTATPDPNIKLEKLSIPYPTNEFRWMLTSANRVIVTQTKDVRIAESKEYMDLSEEALISKVTLEQKGLPDLKTRAKFEKAVGQMALLYDETKDEKYARYA